MTIEQVIELVEKWLADNSSVTVEELSAAAIAASAAADAAAASTAVWAAAARTADAAKHVAEYRELTK
jgi:hypothetical protein